MSTTVVIVAALTLAIQPVAAKFIEDFGKIGTMRTFKGQVRDGMDEIIPDANLKLKHLGSDEIFLLDADEAGNFRKDDLAPGHYYVEVTSSNSNVTAYGVRIMPNSRSASDKYTIVRLSPGCATGNSGVALVNHLSQSSIEE